MTSEHSDIEAQYQRELKVVIRHTGILQVLGVLSERMEIVTNGQQVFLSVRQEDGSKRSYGPFNSVQELVTDQFEDSPITLAEVQSAIKASRA